MNKYNDFITKLFHDNSNNVYSAIELNGLISEEFKVTNNYARQLINRATRDNIIKSSAPFSFSKGQYYYMHPSKSVSLESLKHICQKYRKPLFRLLTLLEINGGVVSLYEARKITSTPIGNEEKYKTISLKSDLHKLREAEFITITTDKETKEQFIIYNSMEPISSQLISNHMENMKEDTLLTLDILRWLSNHGFVTGRPTYRRKDNPSLGAILNDFLFDAYSFSKTSGYHNKGKGNPEEKSVIVVLDILLYRNYSDIDLHSFYDRIQMLRNSTQKTTDQRKVIPIIFYLDIDDETKKQIRNLNILNFSIESILGIQVRKILSNIQSLRRLIQENYNINEKDSLAIIKTIQDSLVFIEESGQSDNLLNLKGDMFETLMFTVLSNMFINATVEHSVLIKNPDEPKKQPYEYDIIIKGRKEIIIIELKGLKNSTIINLGTNKEPNTLLWFFGKTFPIAKKYYEHNSELDKSSIKGCYITSANFSKESIEKLNEINNTKVKPKLLDTFYDRKKLLKLLKEHPNLEDLRESTGFIKTLEKYYLTEETKLKK